MLIVFVSAVEVVPAAAFGSAAEVVPVLSPAAVPASRTNKTHKKVRRTHQAPHERACIVR
jgi:hypothetical protein